MDAPQTARDWLRQEAQALGEALKARALDKGLRKQARGWLRRVWEWEQQEDPALDQAQALLEDLEALRAPALERARVLWIVALRARLLAQWPLKLRCTREDNLALPCVSRAEALYEHRQRRIDQLWEMLEPDSASQARTVNYRSSNADFTVVEKQGSS
jgi:hypothetical protein